MNWDAIGALGEVIGAVAVVVTLGYLAVQLKQNTRAVSSSGLDASITAFNETRRSVYENLEIASIYRRGLEDQSTLDADESLRFRLLMHSILWCIWHIYEQTVLAGLAESTWAAQLPMIRRILGSNGGKWFWATYKHEFEEKFALELDRITGEAQ